MADITDQTFPYELLVRYGTDGKPAGAQVQYLRRITIDGEIVKDDILPAQPIDLAGFPTSALMSDTTRDALAQVTSLTAQVNELATQINAAADTVDKANAHAEALAAENESLIAAEETLRAQVAELTAQLAARPAAAETAEPTS